MIRIRSDSIRDQRPPQQKTEEGDKTGKVEGRKAGIFNEKHMSQPTGAVEGSGPSRRLALEVAIGRTRPPQGANPITLLKKEKIAHSNGASFVKCVVENAADLTPKRMREKGWSEEGEGGDFLAQGL